MTERKKILWLVSWYPNKYDPFEGDFIQRHARAAALYDNIVVLFVKQADEQTIKEVVEFQQGHLTERIIYLPKKKGPAGKFLDMALWWKVFGKEAALQIRQGLPRVIHVHVPWKAGLKALWLKKKYKIPFLVTEHWGIYNNVVEDHIHTRSLLFRRLLKRIYKEANTVISVSRFLGNGINQTLLRKSFTVIPNVVDTTLFFPAQKASRFTFLHVSNMVPLKNVEGILAAFQHFLANSGSGARLVLVGNRDGRYVQLARQMGLPEEAVSFKGELPYGEVAKEMQQAHVLVLNSDMENSPCVIGEALCCGLPVIATAVGGIPELVTQANSILVPPRNPQALAEAFFHLEKNYSRFVPRKIAMAAQETFSFAVVGKRLHQLYHQ